MRHKLAEEKILLPRAESDGLDTAAWHEKEANWFAAGESLLLVANQAKADPRLFKEAAVDSMGRPKVGRSKDYEQGDCDATYFHLSLLG